MAKWALIYDDRDNYIKVPTTGAKMNDLINTVNNLLQCCAVHCQQLLSTTIVHSCSCSTIIVQSLLPTGHQQACFINYCRLLFQQHCNNYCSLSTSNNY